MTVSKLKKTPRSWWFLLRFYLYIIIRMLPLLPYYRYLTKRGETEKRDKKVFSAVRKWADYSVKIGGSTVRVIGTEKLPSDRPVLIIPNHESYADIPMLIHALKGIDFGFMLTVTMTNIPFIGDFLKYMYCVPIDNRNMRKSAESLRKAADFVNDGHSLVIFPEGRRGFSNTPYEFKNGAFKLVQKTGATIVPVYLHNVHMVYEGNERCITPADITITVLDPIETGDMTRADVNRLNETVYKTISDYAADFGKNKN